MDITTKNKISKAMKGHSNFEGKRHSHTAKLAIASARKGKDNIKGLKWAVNRKTGEEHRANSLPARSKWGRVAAFKTWIHSNDDNKKHEEVEIMAKDHIDESKELDQFTTHQHSDENIPPEYNLSDKEHKLIYGDNKKKKEKKNMKEASDDWKQRFADDYHDLKGTKNPEVAKHLKQAVHHYDKGNVEDAHYHMQLAKGVKEAVELPKSVDYSKYDKPTFQRNNPKPERKRPTWAGFNMDKPAYQRKSQADLEARRLNKEEVEQIKESLIKLNEGEYYHEKIAKELPAGLKSEKDVLKHSHEYVKKDLGIKTANYLHHYDQDFPSDLVSNYAHHHKVKLTVESTEEVNEISKSTLGSYIKKASLDTINRQTDYTKEKNVNKIITKGNKITNRFKNIMKATDRLVYNKEDIDEALSDSRDIGFRHGHKGEKQQDFNYRKGSPEQANYIEGYKAGAKAKNVDFLAKFKDRIKHGGK